MMALNIKNMSIKYLILNFIKKFTHKVARLFGAKLGVFDNVEYTFRHANGKVYKKFSISNLVTNAGKAFVAARIALDSGDSGGEAKANYIAVGIGTTAADITDTTLESEITTDGGERVVGTVSKETTDVTDDTIVLTKTFTFTGAFSVSESGVLNDASAGTLLNRQVFSAIPVVSGDSLEITHKFDID